MTELLTSAQMRAVEQAAIGSGAVSGAELMERAGEAVVAAIAGHWPEYALAGGWAEAGTPQALVLCGPGNNGGDGFVIARLLHQRGWQVRVWLYGAPDRLPPDARLNYDRWCETGPVLSLDAGFGATDMAGGLLIDALFGTGLGRGIPGGADGLAAVFAALAQARASGTLRGVVAVDLPSGISADSGLAGGLSGGATIRADLTVSFHRRKPGHILGEGLGRVVVADIGLEPWAGVIPANQVAHEITAPAAAQLAKGSGHKFSHGHALVLAGGPGRGGAARLAAQAALRIGAGLVTLGVPPAALAENAARLDAVMLREVATPADLTAVLADRRISALCLGPGLGLDAREAGLLLAALADVGAGHHCGLVLDADALTLLVGVDHPLPGTNCVLTPHEGEFARLCPDLAAELASGARVGLVRAAAERLGAVVLLKGAVTVIAAPDGRAALHAATGARAAPWLATAGAGDVLAGIIAGLVARGLDGFAAACAAAWLHVECARAFGPGLIAEDLAGQLPGVLRRLGV